jgi:hypothetical protein
LKAKVDGDLPEVWTCKSTQEATAHGERRLYRRTPGQWKVRLSFLPAAEAFGLSDVSADCQDASPSGLRVVLPGAVREGFSALMRTGRDIEVIGSFPSSHGFRRFAGAVIWHDLEQTRPGDSVHVGIHVTREEPADDGGESSLE